MLDDLEEWDAGEGAQEGGDMCIPTADSLSCTAETDIYHCKSLIILQLKKEPKICSC